MALPERILLVDDDPNLLASSQRLFDGRFDITTALGPERGLATIADQGPFAVVVSDMRMPAMDGIHFLAEVRRRAPATVRMMLTGYPDLPTAIHAVNRGAIFQFLTKPCPPETFEEALESGIAQYQWHQSQAESMEAKLRHFQSVELAGQCAAGAVHDMKNYLSIILLQSDLAIEQGATPAEMDTFMRRIRGAAIHANDLTQHMLALCRRRPQPSIRAVDVQKLLHDLCHMLRHVLPASITLQCECADGLVAVSGDASLLMQALLNLALNARDAMPRGGRLGVSAKPLNPEARRETQPPNAGAGRWIGIRVADTGTGLAAGVRQQLFQPFFTTKQEGQGTGLGLSVVDQIVRQHRGWIEVESEPGQGSSFTIFLPVDHPAFAGAASP
jgi:signal transduction histidine kinase